MTTSAVTIGIDLASQPKGTAACVIEWGEGGGVVTELHDELTDAAIVALVRSKPVSKIAIDAPFGWPIAFVEAMSIYATSGRWPGAREKELEFRATDRHVRALIGRWPLSVSTNYLSYIAFRCARLLTELASNGAAIDRTGAGSVLEVYPAAALRQWGIDSRGYKRRAGATEAARLARGEVLSALVRQLRGVAAPWLHLSDAVGARFEESDDLFDALIAALVARALEIGQCLAIPSEHAAEARAEGWIHLPLAEPFASFDPLRDRTGLPGS